MKLCKSWSEHGQSKSRDERSIVGHKERAGESWIGLGKGEGGGRKRKATGGRGVVARN